MKLVTTPAFDADFRRLKPEHRAQFLAIIREKFNPACDVFVVDPSAAWPAALRVKSLRSAPGVLEMTWSFASPDGRATFELVTVDEDLLVRWRRVGDHDVFKRP